jgi:hypothetical protein
MKELQPIDVIGDIHGHLGALNKLGYFLGYNVTGGWSHRQNRILVFVGDLVDRGPDSLGVVRLVMGLVKAGRAVCLMGNHEYNLVGYNLGIEKAKASNRRTVEDVDKRRGEWQQPLEFLQGLPLGIDLPGLRIIHAVWHNRCVEGCRRFLAPISPSMSEGAAAWLWKHAVLGSPFDDKGLPPNLPSNQAVPPGKDSYHEVLIKGFEIEAPEPFMDIDNKERFLLRAMWWDPDDDHSDQIPTDKLTIFGHYWNLPPIHGVNSAVVPRWWSGHPYLRAWQVARAEKVSSEGLADAGPERFVCVDYNGFSEGMKDWERGCVGAYRWPEHQVAWAHT